MNIKTTPIEFTRDRHDSYMILNWENPDNKSVIVMMNGELLLITNSRNCVITNPGWRTAMFEVGVRV